MIGMAIAGVQATETAQWPSLSPIDPFPASRNAPPIARSSSTR
jgi:hypothetical protein